MAMRGSSKEKVSVICRVRPPNSMERERNGTTCVRLSETNVDIQVEDQSHQFQFDRIFGPESTQHAVFEYTAAPLIHDVLQGYNATVFAYGQTGSGKTHTMEGDINNEHTKGIIPRAVEALFEAVSGADKSLQFTFKVSYVEIYMEKIRDLLDETRLKVNLTIHEDKVKGIYVADVTEVSVKSQQELLKFMAAGALNRATAATGMNEGSSRSHSVFTLTVNQKDLRNGVIKSGKLVLVDLAGSEMVRKSNASGQQLEEAKTINKSLSALGGVINALTDDKQTHIPYRDSKLTRILQDSLGGNSKTVLIIAMSPSSYNAPESLSTMRFGMRAKSIENKVTMNQTRSPEELEAIARLREQLVDAHTATTDAEKRWGAVNERNEQLQQDLVAMTASLGQANQLALVHAENHWKEAFQTLKDELALARDAAVALAVQQARDEAAGRLAFSLQTQREALAALHEESHQQALALLTASFDKERKEMQGTLQQAKADIARAHKEAAEATEEVQRSIVELKMGWEETRDQLREEAERRCVDVERRLAEVQTEIEIVTDARNMLQEETIILATELTSLQKQHSTQREDCERRARDMEVMMTQHQQQSGAWEVEKQALNARIVTLETQLQQLPTRKRKGNEAEQGGSEVDKENNEIGVERVMKMQSGGDMSEESPMKKAKLLGLEGTVQASSDADSDNKEAMST